MQRGAVKEVSVKSDFFLVLFPREITIDHKRSVVDSFDKSRLPSSHPESTEMSCLLLHSFVITSCIHEGLNFFLSQCR